MSHSVAGLAAGELIHRSFKPESEPEAHALRRKLFLVACAVAGNFPDLDLVFTNLLPNPLGYLLHHRGHTHTFLYAVPQAILLAGLIWLLWPKARVLLRSSRSARRGLAVSIGTGFFLHLAMDFLNSYGLHPFHPFNSDWYFGDMVYIVEPFFWVIFSAPLLVTIERRKIRNLLGLILASLQLAFWSLGLLPWWSVLLLFASGTGLAWLEKRGGARGRVALAASFCAALLFCSVQYAGSTRAKQLVKAALAARDTSATLVDIAATSSPVNPLCWGFVAVEKNEAAMTYRLTRGRLSLAPDVISVRHCSTVTSESIVDKTELATGLIVTGEDTADLAVLRKLARENCNLRAWLRFARTPYVTKSYAVDQRFSLRGDGSNFSYFNVEDFSNEKCAGPIPGWSFPRADLLGE